MGNHLGQLHLNTCIFPAFNHPTPLNIDRELTEMMIYSGMSCFFWECDILQSDICTNLRFKYFLPQFIYRMYLSFLQTRDKKKPWLTPQIIVVFNFRDSLKCLYILRNCINISYMIISSSYIINYLSRNSSQLYTNSLSLSIP